MGHVGYGREIERELRECVLNKSLPSWTSYCIQIKIACLSRTSTAAVITVTVVVLVAVVVVVKCWRLLVVGIVQESGTLNRIEKREQSNRNLSITIKSCWPPAQHFSSMALDALLLLTACSHVLLTPYTKVEESFNLHATHDVLIYGVDASSLSNARPASSHLLFG